VAASSAALAQPKQKRFIGFSQFRLKPTGIFFNCSAKASLLLNAFLHLKVKAI
jgi:hypothetical protein